MTLRPCLDCGEPSVGPRCPDHARLVRVSPRDIGYDSTWQRLSERARRLQPFCSICGTGDDLTTDHSPEAWLRRARGRVIRLADVDVLCRSHNSAKGTTRPRGTAPRRRRLGVVPSQNVPLSPNAHP